MGTVPPGPDHRVSRTFHSNLGHCFLPPRGCPFFRCRARNTAHGLDRPASLEKCWPIRRSVATIGDQDARRSRETTPWRSRRDRTIDPFRNRTAALARDFLRTSSLLGAALAAGAGGWRHAAGNDTIRVGLIGCGGRGTRRRRAGDERRQGRQARRHGRHVPATTSTPAASHLRDDGGDRFDVARRPLLRRLRRLQAGDRQRRRPRAPGHPAGLPPAAPPGRGRRRQALSSPRSPSPSTRPASAPCSTPARRPRRRTSRSSPASAGATRRACSETIKRIHDGAIGDDPGRSQSHVQHRQNLWMTPRRDPTKWTRHGVAAPQLVLLHLAQRRPHRRAARPQPRQGRLGDEGRATRSGRRHGRPAGPHRPRVRQHLRPPRRRLRVRQRRRVLQHVPPAGRRANDVSDYIYGTGGTATSSARTSGTPDHRRAPLARRRGRHRANMYQEEHDELFASIRSSNPINDGE